MDTIDELDWCLDQLETVQTHRSVSDMASLKVSARELINIAVSCSVSIKFPSICGLRFYRFWLNFIYSLSTHAVRPRFSSNVCLTKSYRIWVSQVNRAIRYRNTFAPHFWVSFFLLFFPVHSSWQLGSQPLPRRATGFALFARNRHESKLFNSFRYQFRQAARSRCADIRQSTIGGTVDIIQPDESALSTHNVADFGLQASADAHQFVYERSLAGIRRRDAAWGYFGRDAEWH